VKLSSFDSVVLAVEINFTITPPEGITNRQKFLGTSIPLIVREKIAVAALLLSGAAGDDVQIDSALN
jgi:hypothetical protein